jgi:D-alanine-D-alanine ligase
LQAAEKAYAAVRANSVSRVDMRYDPTRNRIVILEINTVPGMSSLSATPKAVKGIMGLEQHEFIQLLIDDGLDYWNKKVAQENYHITNGDYQTV